MFETAPPLLYLVVLYLFTSVVLLLVAGWVARSATSRNGSREFFALLIACSLWSAFAAGQHLTTEQSLQVLFAQIMGVAAVCVPALSFAFVMQYSHAQERLRTLPVRLFVGGGAVVSAVLIGTNGWLHTLVFVDAEIVATSGHPGIFDFTAAAGTGYWAIFAWGYAVMGAAYLQLLRSGVSSNPFHRFGVLSIVAGTSVMGVTHVLTHTPANPTVLDLTPVGLLFFAVGAAGALFRQDFLDVGAIGRDRTMDNIPDPMITVDATGQITDMNAAAKRLVAALRRQSGEQIDLLTGTVPVTQLDLSGEPVDELPDVLAGLFPSTVSQRPHVASSPPPTGKATHTDGGSMIDAVPGAEKQLYADDLISVEMDEYPWHYKSHTTEITVAGRTIGHTLVLRDVTALVEREKELERQNERLDDFAGVVSHDLRNPLATASARLELARETHDETHYESIEEALDRMDEIIEDVLTMSREGGKITEPEPISLFTVAAEAAEQVERGGLTINVDVEPAVEIEADDSRLQTLFENLYRNAIDHNDPPVTVTVTHLPDDIGFRVADDGSGIPPDERDTIFEQGHTTASDGTGFGLAIVQEVAHAHGWQVNITDSEYGGAAFDIHTTPD